MYAGIGREEELMAELEVMQSINGHPYVIELIPYWAPCSSCTCIVMEFAERGNLKKLLIESRNNGGLIVQDGSGYLEPIGQGRNLFDRTDQMYAAWQIASGMEHLATNGVCHSLYLPI